MYVKNKVGRENTEFKMAATRQLLINSLNCVTTEDWKKRIKHAIKEENLIWNIDHPVSVEVEPMIIEFNENDDDDDDDWELLLPH